MRKKDGRMALGRRVGAGSVLGWIEIASSASSDEKGKLGEYGVVLV